MPATNVSHLELEYAIQRLQQFWYDLAMAEQRGQPGEVLERLCRLYLGALEEYIELSRRLEQPLAS